MKALKVIACLVLVIVLSCCIFCSAETSVMGDINGDKNLSVSDLVHAKKVIALSEALYDSVALDFDCDGSISTGEFLLLREMLLQDAGLEFAININSFE